MKYKFLLHSLSHTTLAINVTGLSLNVAGVGVNGASLPFVQYNSWDRAKQRFWNWALNRNLWMPHINT